MFLAFGEFVRHENDARGKQLAGLLQEVDCRGSCGVVKGNFYFVEEEEWGIEGGSGFGWVGREESFLEGRWE